MIKFHYTIWVTFTTIFTRLVFNVINKLHAAISFLVILNQITLNPLLSIFNMALFTFPPKSPFTENTFRELFNWFDHIALRTFFHNLSLTEENTIRKGKLERNRCGLVRYPQITVFLMVVNNVSLKRYKPDTSDGEQTSSITVR